MKYHLTGFGVSALAHAGVLLAVLPLLFWQGRTGQVEAPQAVQLSLAQFVPAPKPVEKPVASPVPPPVQEAPKPESKPQPKPVEKTKVSKPLPKKPKPEKKPVKKPEAVPQNVAPKAEPQPKRQPDPVAVAKPQPQVAAAVAHPVAAPSPAARPVAPVSRAAPLAPAVDNKAAEAAYKARLQSLIASRKQYPRLAEKAEVEGSVVVSFTVLPNGAITGVRVSKSAGNDWLDKAAVQAVNAASGALPFPPEIRKPQWVFSLTVNFKLDG